MLLQKKSLLTFSFLFSILEHPLFGATCPQYCKTCQGSSVRCKDCYADSLRPTLSNGVCICKAGYYSLTVLDDCKSCRSTCQTCKFALNYENNQKCLTCQPNRVLKNGSCLCQAPYIESADQTCNGIPCSYQCMTCDLGICLECGPNRIGLPCDTCEPGYYDDGVSSQCLECDKICDSCKQTSKNCISCSDELRSPPDCNCIKGYFRFQGDCQPCEFPCEECIKTATTCTSCRSPEKMDSTNNCSCNMGYYLADEQCKECPKQCATCDSEKCLTCPPDSMRIASPNQQGKCTCLEGYQDVDQTVCTPIESAQQDVSIVSPQVSNDTPPAQAATANKGTQTNQQSQPSDQVQQTSLPQVKSAQQPLQTTVSEQTTSSQDAQAEFSNYSEVMLIVEMAGDSCDDDNSKNGDGCSAKRKVEPGSYCSRQYGSHSECHPCQTKGCYRCTLDLSFKQYCVECADDLILFSDTSKCLAQSELTAATVSCQEGLAYSYESNSCEPVCGDSITLYDFGEQCDFGSLNIWFGCNEKCQYRFKIEGCNNPTRNNKFCSYKLIFLIATLADSDSNDIEIHFMQLPTTFKKDLLVPIKSVSILPYCNQLKYRISGINSGTYNYSTSINSKKLNCRMTLTYAPKINKRNQIEIKMENKTMDNYYFIRLPPYIFDAHKRYNYTRSQELQGAAAQKSIIGINRLLMILFGVTILLGGFSVLWQIFDLYNWLVTFYFFSVAFPLNVELFFQYISWAQILFLENPIVLNQPGDDYYLQTPERFASKGQDSLFINSVWYDIYAIGFFLAIYPFAWIMCLILRTKAVKIPQNPPSRTFLKISLRKRTQSLQMMKPKVIEKKLNKVHSQGSPMQAQANFTLMASPPDDNNVDQPGRHTVQETRFGIVSMKVLRSMSKQKSLPFSKNNDSTKASNEKISSPKNNDSGILISPQSTTQTLTKQEMNCLSRLRNIIQKSASSYRDKIKQKLLRVFYLTMLDFEIASVLQLHKLSLASNWIVELNIGLSLVYQAASFIYLYLCYIKVNRSQILLLYLPYRRQYSSLYEDMDASRKNIYRYSFASVLKKKLFIIGLVAFYTQPLMQTISCSLITFLHLLLLLYENPYRSKIHRYRQLVPEVVVWVIVEFVVLLALDEEYNIWNLDDIFALGWVIISMLIIALLHEVFWIICELFKLIRKRYQQLRYLCCNKMKY